MFPTKKFFLKKCSQAPQCVQCGKFNIENQQWVFDGITELYLCNECNQQVNNDNNRIKSTRKMKHLPSINAPADKAKPFFDPLLNYGTRNRNRSGLDQDNGSLSLLIWNDAKSYSKDPSFIFNPTDNFNEIGKLLISLLVIFKLFGGMLLILRNVNKYLILRFLQYEMNICTDVH